MGKIAILIGALLAGVLIGTVFYGGLWWTVRRSVSARYLGVWVLGSFLLRTLGALSGFYFVARDDWRALLACLLGFLIARLCVTRLTRPSVDQKQSPLQGLEL